MDEKTIEGLVRKHLKEGFPLFDESDNVNVSFGDDNVYISYSTTSANIPREETHFHLQIERDICFLLNIQLLEKERGKGNGKSLYQSIENFAREYGCDIIRMTASGRTKTRKRKEYLVEELGYEVFGDIEVIKSL